MVVAKGLANLALQAHTIFIDRPLQKNMIVLCLPLLTNNQKKAIAKCGAIRAMVQAQRFKNA